MRVTWLVFLLGLTFSACHPVDEPEWYVDDEGCAVGHVYVYTPKDLAKIKGINCFRNDLVIGAEGKTTLSSKELKDDTFLNVTRIEGLFIGQLADLDVNGMEENEGIIFMPLLEHLVVLATSETPGLKRFDFPILQNAQAIDIEKNPDLEVINFPELVDISEQLRIAHNNPLTTFDFSKLKAVGDPTAPIFSFDIEVLAVDHFSFPELEEVRGEVSIRGLFAYDPQQGTHLSMPKFKSASKYFSIESSNLASIDLPEFTQCDQVILNGVFEVPDQTHFALEEVGSISLTAWLSPGNVVTLPYLRKAGSISMSFGHGEVLYMPALEELGSLSFDDVWTMRDVDLPNIQCLGSVSTLCSFTHHMFCLLPEALDDEVARSQANGCDTQIDICDPRTNVYFPYDEEACLNQE